MIKPQQFIKIGLTAVSLSVMLGESVLATSSQLKNPIAAGRITLRDQSQYSHLNPVILAQNSSNSEADRLLNEGLELFQQGTAESLRQALEKWQAARQLYHAAGDKGTEAVTLLSMGRINDDLGEKQQALDYLNQALPLFRAVGDRRGEAATLNNIGAVYSSLGEKQKALDYYNQALPLSRAVGDRRMEAITLNNIGNVYDSLGEMQQALDYYNQALPLLRAVGDRGGEATTLSNFAYLKRNQGNLSEALTDIETAITIVEDLRTKIGSQELRQSYFATVQDYYKFYIDLLMQLHQQNPQKGYDALAFHASERSRARSLVELLTEAGANIRQGVDPKLLEQEQNLLQQLNAVEYQRYQLTQGQYTETQIDELKAKSQAFSNQLNQLQTQIRLTSPRYAALKYPQPLNLPEVQQLLDEDTLLLQYSLGEERSFLWLVSKNSINTYILPKQSEIKTAVETYLQSFNTENATLKDGLPLSQILLSPVANQLAKKRLLIVGDGALQLIPFAALPIPNTPQNPLLVENEIITLPSISTVAIQRQQLQNRPSAPKTVAVIADPIFESNDPRLNNQIVSENHPPTQNDLARNRATRNSGLLGNTASELDRLKYSRYEAENIAQLVPENARLKALDFEASLATATNPNLAEYQIVHFATHGLFDPVNPELSGIVLSLYDKTGNKQDGFLRLSNIFNLDLPTELVVLSACQTGVGKEMKGEGLVGLTRGFMYAGARRVIVSLWSVNDASTSELMTKFYQKMLQGEENPIHALRQTQLEMWKSEGWQSPYYWGAFTVQGDWR